MGTGVLTETHGGGSGKLEPQTGSGPLAAVHGRWGATRGCCCLDENAPVRSEDRNRPRPSTHRNFKRSRHWRAALWVNNGCMGGERLWGEWRAQQPEWVGDARDTTHERVGAAACHTP